MNPDGSWLATADEDAVRLWDALEGHPLASVRVDGAVSSLCWLNAVEATLACAGERGVYLFRVGMGDPEVADGRWDG